MLLGLERVHLHRDFGGRDQIRQEDKPPAAELRTVAEIEILGQRVVLPATRIDDRFATPDAGRAVEVEEVARTISPAVLEHEVTIEQDRLDLREQRVILIDVSPARLDHRDLRIDEERHRPVEKVLGRDEVRIEDGDELALGDLHAGLERASLVACAIGSMDVGDVDALRRIAPHGLFGHAPRFVGRIVEDLDLEQLARILQSTDGVDETIRHVHLVVDRELDRDRRELVHRSRRDRLLPLVLHVQVHEVVPVPTVHSKNDKNEEIRPENQRFRSGHATGKSQWGMRILIIFPLFLLREP